MLKLHNFQSIMTKKYPYFSWVDMKCIIVQILTINGNTEKCTAH